MTHTASLSVVICMYTERRWPDIKSAVASVEVQGSLVAQLVIVVDHHQELLTLAAETWGRRHTVVPNRHERGLSGARNTGIESATGDIVAFLDDDAVAGTGWAAAILQGYQDDSVVGVGGSALPAWDGGRKPRWFPLEFGWVVGCSYTGQPTRTQPVRNFIGANMSLRRDIFGTVGGFRDGIGRVGTRPVGCEETELCIRVRQARPELTMLYEPSAEVRHRVTKDRTTVRYFVRRCYSEGLSKALISTFVGQNDALSAERAYTTTVLPQGVRAGLRDAGTGDVTGLGRAVAIVVGFVVTALGYTVGRSRTRGGGGPAATVPAPSGRTFTGRLELSDPPDSKLFPIPSGYQRARILVRFHGEVLGYLNEEVPAEGLRTADLVQRCTDSYQDRITAHLALENAQTGCPSRPRATPPVTLVVCTRNRAETLASCLADLRALDYPQLEIVIVDNAPTDDSTHRTFTREVGADTRFRYVREPVAGLSRARNRGIAEAKGEFIAYTDDDVTVEPDWISALVLGFERDQEVGCVTGLVATATIEGPAEQYFDARVSWAHDCQPRLYDLKDRVGDNPLYPYSPGIFGTGANFAFRRRTLESIGGFDEALGAGTLTRGGEDLDAFVLVLRAGWVLAYEPSAVVWHHHRSDLDALNQQMYGYGTGLAAFVTKHLLDRRSAVDVVRRVVPGSLRLLVAFRTASRTPGPAIGSSRRLVLSELRGLLTGPVLYLRGRRVARKAAKLL